MATKVEAAHQMMVMAAGRKDSGHRNDLEAGMAKYLASEYGKEVGNGNPASLTPAPGSL
jgi:alkylation response protein AidB-like acyl-CoA dehydrogenase